MWSKVSFLRWVKRLRCGGLRRAARPALAFESLEDRSLPATDLYSPQALATIQVAQAEFAGPMARAGFDLAYLFTDYRFNASPSYQPLNSLLQVSGGSVIVDVLPQVSVGAAGADLAGLGFRPIAASQYVLSGALPILSLEAAALLPSVRAIQAAYKPITSVGAVDSQGVRSIQSDSVTSFLGLDGTGQTIGVISDSFNSLGGATGDVASGDLPGPGNPFNHTTPVNVLDDSLSGSDEGRAMLQIVHDTAPGAKLAFATGGATQTQFQNNIVALANAGASIIVDDFQFLNEPMFQDGIVAKAVDQAVQAGVAYFAAAGNAGRASYEQAFHNSGTDLTGTGAYKVPAAMSPNFFAHDFNSGGTSQDLFQTITLPPGKTSFSFQWTDPYFSSSGGAGAQTNLNIAVFDMAGNFISTTGGFSQNIGGDPIEVFSIDNSTGAAMQVQIAIGKVSGPDPALMKYVAFQPVGQNGFSIDEYPTNSGTIFGHANAAGAEAVGAALYSETPPYGVNPPQLESYSSRGTTPIYFNANGVLLGTPVTRQSPDIVAPDGVNTTFFGQADPTGSGGFEGDGSPNFFGTSAAAPHAAAVAALLRQAKPSLSPAQIYSALETTAIDMNAPGYDFDSGWGLINAAAAVISVNGGPYAVTFNGTAGDDAMVVRRDTSGNSIEFVLGGTVKFSIPAAQVNNIVAKGFGGNDTLTLDSTRGAVNRPLAWDGGSGTDGFAILGTADIPAELNVFDDATLTPTVTLFSGTMPAITLSGVETATLTPTNGIVNLIGDNNQMIGQADSFVVVGTGANAFTATLNHSFPLKFLGAGALNVYGQLMTDTLAITPWASNGPAGWGVQTYYNGGTSADEDLLIFNTVAANPVSEDIAIQPSTIRAGEIRVTNAADGSAIAIISYANTDLAVNDTHNFATNTDTLTLRGTNAADVFLVNLLAAGTATAPMVDVQNLGADSLYRLRSFTGFSILNIVGLGGNDTLNLLAGKDDGSIALNVDLNLPPGGPNPSDRDRILITGTSGSDFVRFTAGTAPGSGHLDVKRSTASAPTPIDFINVEAVDFDGGGATASDQIIIAGTSGNDAFTMQAAGLQWATAQVNAGPILGFFNWGSSGVNFTLDGLDGADSFTITQGIAWAVASLTIDGGGGGDTVSLFGSSNDDRYTWTPSSALLVVEAPLGAAPVPYTFANVIGILVDALGHTSGDRLTVTEPVGYTPTPNSGTFPTTPPLSYRNVEFISADQLPTLTADNVTTNEDTPITIDVLANDTGIGDGPITLTIANPPLHGTAVVVNNRIQYTPNADYNDLAAGPDVLTYQVTDANGDTATALVTIHITPVNDRPIAHDTTVTVQQGVATNLAFFGEDGDPEVNQTLTYTLIPTLIHGTITNFNPATGQFTYQSEPNFSGQEVIFFTVTDDATAGGPALTSLLGTITINVLSVNNLPVANPLNTGTAEGTPLAFTLTGDDGDPEIVQTLTFAIVVPPAHGTITSFNPATGKGVYVPDLNYNGPDSFQFVVTDDATAGGPALTSDPATVGITITAVNAPPIAFSQAVTGNKNSVFSITLTGDDGDPEVVQTLIFSIASLPQHGQLINFNPLTGAVTYVPAANFTGSDQFTFTVTDDATAGGPPRTSNSVGIISLTVLPVNNPPVAFPQSLTTNEDSALTIVLTGNDGDPGAGQTLTFAIASGPSHGTITNFDSATGKLTYTPAANYNGPDSFAFTVTDDSTAGGPAKTSPPATISLTVPAVNDRPVAVSQSVSVQANKSVIITLTADDGDPELTQALTFAIASGPAHGTLTALDPTTTTTGSVRWLYRPNPAYSGSDSFSFTATDNGSPPLTSVPATVNLTVAPPPPAWIATGAGEGGGPQVKVFDARTGALIYSFFAYDQSFTGGVRVAIGDVNNDGVPDIITGAGVGGYPHVKVFSGKDLSLLASFFAFDIAFAGGITVASGDIDGLPGDEIVVGAGAGGGPHVRTFQLINGAIEQLPGPLGSFFAYDSGFTGGVNVAVGNFDGLPGDEIITGAGMSGGPHVKVFAASGATIASFFAFPDDGRLGVSVAAGDVDGDGKAEILTGPGIGGGPIPRVFAGGTAVLRDEFPAFDPGYRGGIAVGITDADGDGLADLLIAPTQAARSVQVFKGDTLDLLDEFNAYDANFAGGVYIAGK